MQPISADVLFPKSTPAPILTPVDLQCLFCQGIRKQGPRNCQCTVQSPSLYPVQCSIIKAFIDWAAILILFYFLDLYIKILAISMDSKKTGSASYHQLKVFFDKKLLKAKNCFLFDQFLIIQNCKQAKKNRMSECKVQVNIQGKIKLIASAPYYFWKIEQKQQILLIPLQISQQQIPNDHNDHDELMEEAWYKNSKNYIQKYRELISWKEQFSKRLQELQRQLINLAQSQSEKLQRLSICGQSLQSNGSSFFFQSLGKTIKEKLQKINEKLVQDFQMVKENKQIIDNIKFLDLGEANIDIRQRVRRIRNNNEGDIERFIIKFNKVIHNLQKSNFLCKKLTNFQDGKNIMIEAKQKQLFDISNLMNIDPNHLIVETVKQIVQVYQQKQFIQFTEQCPFKLLFQADCIASSITNAQFKSNMKANYPKQYKIVYAISVLIKNSMIIHRYQFVEILQIMVRQNCIKDAQIQQKVMQLSNVKQEFAMIILYGRFLKFINDKLNKRSIILAEIDTNNEHQKIINISSLSKKDFFSGSVNPMQIILQDVIYQYWVQNVALITEYLSSKSLKNIAHFRLVVDQNNQIKIFSGKCQKRNNQLNPALNNASFIKFIKKDKLNWLKCFTQAILQLEQIGIFHNDLRLQNFIYVNGQFKVIDFDLAFYVGQQENIELRKYCQLILMLFVNGFRDQDLLANIFFKNKSTEYIEELFNKNKSGQDWIQQLRKQMHFHHKNQYIQLIKQLTFNGRQDQRSRQEDWDSIFTEYNQLQQAIKELEKATKDEYNEDYHKIIDIIKGIIGSNISYYISTESRN